jgi:DNA-binding MarR family transcriptional regulator
MTRDGQGSTNQHKALIGLGREVEMVMKRPARVANNPSAISLQSADGLAADNPAIQPGSTPRYSGTIRAATQIALVRGLLEERKLRNRFLPEKVLGDAAWDILLTLYLGWCENQMTPVNLLADATAAPKTTVLRWTVALSELGLVSRVTNADDRRITEVSLTAAGLAAIEGYLSALHDLRSRHPFRHPPGRA